LTRWQSGKPGVLVMRVITETIEFEWADIGTTVVVLA
jgi:hypothetical protein